MHHPDTRRLWAVRYDSRVRVTHLVICTLAASGCMRDPAAEVCPDLAVGDLVVTEVRGPQTGNDALEPYVELYNASGHMVDLFGTKVRFRKKDGSGEVDIFVRRALTAAAGSYTVLGLEDDAQRSAYVDYGFVHDFNGGWLSAAAVDVETCGTRIDRATYDSLPRTGTYSLGVTPPSADTNDLPSSWCTDATTGTPQQANVACP
jgi:hypothetical protein